MLQSRSSFASSMTLLEILLILLICTPGLAHAAYQNVTTVLGGHPQYSTFDTLLVSSGVAPQINSLTAITLLCPPNAVMDAFMSTRGKAMDRQTLFNILSYHVLLDYQDPTKMRSIAPTGVQVTTLFQTTGLAAGGNGNVNITGSTTGVPLAHIRIPGAPANAAAANIISPIELFPYNISLLAIDNVLVPQGSSLPVSPPVNITQIISQSGNFSHFLALLKITGVGDVFQSHDTPPGITIFVPSNAAIESLNRHFTLSSSQIVTLLQYHAMPEFYPAQVLTAAAVPQPTLASSDNRDSFTLYTTGTQHDVTVHSDRNEARVVANLYSSNPVSIFAIDAVLQPKEIFTQSAGPAPAAAAMSPEANSDELNNVAPAPAPANDQLNNVAPGPAFESVMPSPGVAPAVMVASPASDELNDYIAPAAASPLPAFETVMT